MTMRMFDCDRTARGLVVHYKGRYVLDHGTSRISARCPGRTFTMSPFISYGTGTSKRGRMNQTAPGCRICGDLTLLHEYVTETENNGQL